MTEHLVALLGGRAVGQVHRDRRGRLSFVYNDDWRNARGAYPLSVSMPLAAVEHGNAVIEAFLWGLLPDNEFVLDRWARKFQVSARSAFALISHVGEDCAGAVQFIRPDRVEAYSGNEEGTVDWIDEHGVAERLRMLRADHSAWRAPRDTGQFSLAGAQPKTALLLANGRWGVPSGRVPTTHILKPPMGEFDGHAENEHLCLALARRLGMPTVSSHVMRFEDQTAIVVERYDRRPTNRGLIRIHQEDICQALGVSPTRKYENEGGPGARAVVDLLREYSG
ncbi:MAG: HipA domain-containing protein, partial [Nitratireductor sp.]